MKYKLISSATMPGNINLRAEEKSPADEKLRFTFLSFLVFAIGLPASFGLNVIGEMFLTEMLLPILAILVLLISGKTRVLNQPLFLAFFIVGICMLIGYIISDVVAGTDSSRYLRAWGRNIILFTDFIALTILVSIDRRLLWWFIVGMSIGGLAGLLINHVPFVEWKIGYGMPVIFLSLCLGFFLPKRLVMFSLLGLATVSIFMDGRSLGAICLIVAGVIFVRIKKPDGLKLSASAMFRILVAAGLVVAFLITLMIQTEDEFSNRRASSSEGRFTALSIGLTAVTDSPFIGYGSWGEGTKKYADMYYNEMAPEMRRLGRIGTLHRSDIFRPHSQILQAWIEGGMLAGAFFIFLGYQLFVGIKELVLSRRLDSFTSLYVFLLVLSFWHLIMSPYSGSHRLLIALAIAVLCLIRFGRVKQ